MVKDRLKENKLTNWARVWANVRKLGFKEKALNYKKIPICNATLSNLNSTRTGMYYVHSDDEKEGNDIDSMI